MSKVRQYISIILWMMDNDYFICTRNTCMKRSEGFNEDYCRDSRDNLRRLKGSGDASHALKTIFTLETNVTGV